MDKGHIACFAGGVALASAYFWYKSSKKDSKSVSNPSKAVDTESEEYLHLKNEQLARIIKYFGE